MLIKKKKTNMTTDFRCFIGLYNTTYNELELLLKIQVSKKKKLNILNNNFKKPGVPCPSPNPALAKLDKIINDCIIPVIAFRA